MCLCEYFYVCPPSVQRIANLCVCVSMCQLIERFKREIQSLKEELAMVTGEQREDQLTAEEIQKYVPSVYLNVCPFKPVSL